MSTNTPEKRETPEWRCKDLMPDGTVCDRVGYIKGQCVAHNRGHHPKVRVPAVGVCAVPLCPRKVEARELCSTHYARRYTRKEPNWDRLIAKKDTTPKVLWNFQARVTVETAAFIVAHAKSRGMSVYQLSSEVWRGWYAQQQERQQYELETVDIISPDSRRGRLRDLLNTKFFGATRMEIFDALEDDYPELLTQNSASERRFYRDLMAIEAVHVKVDGVPVYLAKQHAHRRREEVDSDPDE